MQREILWTVYGGSAMARDLKTGHMRKDERNRLILVHKKELWRSDSCSTACGSKI